MRAAARPLDFLVSSGSEAAVKPIDEILRERFLQAMGRAFGAENMVDPLIKTADPKFADYQSNIAMALGKRMGVPPREAAQRIVSNLAIEDMCEEPTIAGPGFINLKLKKSFLVAALTEAFAGVGAARAGVEKVAQASGIGAVQTVVIDYSGPMWPNKCTSGICGRRFWAIRWRGCWSFLGTQWCGKITSVISARSSAC